jgi:hypothetical protein
MEKQPRETDVVAAVVFDSAVADVVTPLLHTQNITPLVVPKEKFASQRINLSSESSQVSFIFESLKQN